MSRLLARLIRLATEQTVRESPLWTRQPGGLRIRTSRRRFAEQPLTAGERTHNVSRLHANSAGISVRWTKRHLEVRILSAQPGRRLGMERSRVSGSAPWCDPPGGSLGASDPKTRIHPHARRHGSHLAARVARAADSDVGGRVSHGQDAECRFLIPGRAKGAREWSHTGDALATSFGQTVTSSFLRHWTMIGTEAAPSCPYSRRPRKARQWSPALSASCSRARRWVALRGEQERIPSTHLSRRNLAAFWSAHLSSSARFQSIQFQGLTGCDVRLPVKFLAGH